MERLEFLVVDDMDMLRDMAKIGVLRSYPGYEVNVDTANDGTDMVRLATEKRYNGIISDINMTAMDGLTAVENLRIAGVTTKVLIYASKPTHENLQRMDKLGLPYIEKPSPLAIFAAKLHEIWPEYAPRPKEAGPTGN